MVSRASFAATIYGLIRDGKHAEAAKILHVQLANFPRSRAALSLLGHCYYQMQVSIRALFVCKIGLHIYMQDFRSAAAFYEELTKFHPEVEDYKVYYAQVH
jgi:tetratricopeptide repeat protein 30